ncbi:MAG: TIGR01440 family protein [Negativicutes bacterium]|nr:TIGR01440 family protein [Negativicutes bacterium]
MGEGKVFEQARVVFEEFLARIPRFDRGIVVIGCSTSEIAGCPIGSNGSLALAGEVWQALTDVFAGSCLTPAVQCCEHLNRALVIGRSAQEEYRLDEVMAVPILRAGGALAAVAYRQLCRPVLVGAVSAVAGIDIGETMIGMHIRPVAKPLRLTNRRIGQARVNAAYSRPPLIGGERAVYTSQGGNDGKLQSE